MSHRCLPAGTARCGKPVAVLPRIRLPASDCSRCSRALENLRLRRCPSPRTGTESRTSLDTPVQLQQLSNSSGVSWSRPAPACSRAELGSFARACRGPDARAAAPAVPRRGAASTSPIMRPMQRVRRCERPRCPGAFRHPRRMLEDPAQRCRRTRPGPSRFSSSALQTPASPSTRTSRTLSAPASVNSAASMRSGSSARLQHAGQRAVLRRAAGRRNRRLSRA